MPIFGEPQEFRVRAEVAKLNELSGHADQHELLDWMKPMAGKGLKRVFLVHGEPQQQKALARAIQEKRHGLEVTEISPHAAGAASFSIDPLSACYPRC